MKLSNQKTDLRATITLLVVVTSCAVLLADSARGQDVLIQPFVEEWTETNCTAGTKI